MIYCHQVHHLPVLIIDKDNAETVIFWHVIIKGQRYFASLNFILWQIFFNRQIFPDHYSTMDKEKKLKVSKDPVPIVSSEHLASEDSWPLSELEYGLIIAHNAFTRWMIRCMQGAGYPDFSPLDVLVLHNVNHRNRQKKLLDICFVLHIEDQHTVNYSLKKLVKAKLIEREKHGKEIYYSTTEQGKKACDEYREVREKCLTSGYRNLDRDGSEVSQAAALLRLMSGLYDQASRAASSL